MGRLGPQGSSIGEEVVPQQPLSQQPPGFCPGTREEDPALGTLSEASPSANSVSQAIRDGLT